MGIGAVKGYGFGDYSWYKPGTSGITEDFDMAYNQWKGYHNAGI